MRHLAFSVFVALALAFAPAVVRAEATGALLGRAVALACDDEGDNARAMAEALPGGATVEAARALAMNGVRFGWRRRFALADGGRLAVIRIAIAGRLRRIEARYDERAADGGLRPGWVALAGPGCAIRAARRLVYDAAGRAERLVALDPESLAETGESAPLNPPVPAGADPGGVTVALVDSGVNYLLPEIARALARDEDGAILGYDYWDMDARPFDADTARSPFFPQRHGTRVASVLLREGGAVRLIPYRYPRPDPSRWRALIDDAAAKGARIALVPMGSNRAETWADFVAAVKAHPEMLFIVSAGNDGRDLDRRPVYPAAFNLDNMISVGSADGLGRPAEGSNWGARTVDLLVPAEGVPATDFTGRPTRASGSSFAVPRLGALAARLLARRPDLDAGALRNALIARARMTDAGGPPTSRYGFLDPGG